MRFGIWRQMRRLRGDVTSGRGDNLRQAEASIAAGEGASVEDLVVNNDRPVETVAREVMAWLGGCALGGTRAWTCDP